MQLTKGNKDWTNKAGTSIECAEWEIQRLQDLERTARRTVQHLQRVEASLDMKIAELRDTELALIGERTRHTEALKVLEEERKRAETKHPSDDMLPVHLNHVCQAYISYEGGSHPEAVAHAVLWLLRRAEREG